jgi:alanine racemase
VYTISDIALITQGRLLQGESDRVVKFLLTDSRRLSIPASTLFIALPGKGRTGMAYLSACYEAGVRSFLVDQPNEALFATMPDASIILVPDALHGLQQLAAHHRSTFAIQVIGITGSNGKTIIKEWLHQLLHHLYHIVRSPKSFNSQIGVPLSVWQMHAQHDLAIFEAGISERNEMLRLESIIRPDIGILTHMGDAHASGFSSQAEKIREKLTLFTSSKVLIYASTNQLVVDCILAFKATVNPNLITFCIGKNPDDDIRVLDVQTHADQTSLTLAVQQDTLQMTLPFTDNASVENALLCLATLVYLKQSVQQMQEAFRELKSLEMRLELKQGNHQCLLINDSYSNDFDSLQIALEFLSQQAPQFSKTMVLSDFPDTGNNTDEAYAMLPDLLMRKGIHRLIGVGPALNARAEMFKQIPTTQFYNSTDALMLALHQLSFQHEVILIKGARKFGLEKLLQQLEQKRHQTVLEIDLNAMRNNLRRCREILHPGVKMMAMVKAFGYGSGSHEIAGLLQFEGVDYLAVAYADEGVALREAGIRLPIMVMNPNPSEFDWLMHHQLEPEIFSLDQWKQWSAFVQRQAINDYPIHLKLDTGMHRLGFLLDQLDAWLQAFQQNPNARIISVFSHLVASEDSNQDAYTEYQGQTFFDMAKRIEAVVGYPVLKHLANSSAIHRHPELQFDMVRFGIGLYGVGEMSGLQPVATLKTTIAQIKLLKKGDTVGYNRKGVLDHDSKIGTVRIGYADGYPRLLGNGKGSMWIKGKLVPTVGNVCMDMTMIDLTDVDAAEGDEVVVFGAECPVQQVAQWANTIPYEILTGIAQRVKRIYFES